MSSFSIASGGGSVICSFDGDLACRTVAINCPGTMSGLGEPSPLGAAIRFVRAGRTSSVGLGPGKTSVPLSIGPLPGVGAAFAIGIL